MAICPPLFLSWLGPVVNYVAGTVCPFFYIIFVLLRGKTFAVKTYSVLINIIRFAGVTIFHPDTNDFGVFISDVGKKLLAHVLNSWFRDSCF